MKSASTDLKNFLVSARAFWFANLYTLTLPGGTVIRWTSADQPTVANGQTFARGPLLTDSGVKLKRGLEVSTIEIGVAAKPTDLVGGVPLLEFMKANGFDGATVKVERAFAASWDTAIIGTMIRFSGRYSESRDVGETRGLLIAASWPELLNVDMPADVYQASCLHTVFDSGCGLDRNSFDAAGVVGAAAKTTTTFPSNLATTAGTYNAGTVVFTSGANNGQRRTVRSQDASGNIVLVRALPAAPGTGDTFIAYPGCDLQKATCFGKFNNLAQFNGASFIPEPETAL